MIRPEDRRTMANHIAQACAEGARLGRTVPWPASMPAPYSAGRPGWVW